MGALLSPKQRLPSYSQKETNMRTHLSIAAVLASSLLLAGCSSGEKRPDPINEVVILLDASATYKARQAEAISRALALLESIAETKVRRWEQSNDKIAIITVDAVPEVIWQGSIRDLKALKSSDWTDRFKARTDYANCTDVEAAFKLAAKNLQGDPQYVNKYLWAYTDLIHEPPAKSIRKCEPPAKPSVPSEEFPWTEFQDVSVSVFWVPPEQKLAWKRAVTDHGLAVSFALYTTSESGQVKIPPPPKPTPKITDADRNTDREAYKQSAVTLLEWIGIVLVGFIAVVGISPLIARSLHRRRGGSARRPNPSRGVPTLAAARMRAQENLGPRRNIQRPAANRQR
jgi:outer membrane murein-binding lipoprotein Lpp